MAVNYGLLKESENEIMFEFNSFYELVLNINNELYNYLMFNINNENEVMVNDEQLDAIIDMTKRAEITENDLLANCIWLIQKNEPRASHLRFIIAIIHSIKNLISITYGTLKLAKFFNKNTIAIELLKELMNAYKATNDISKKIAESLSNRNISLVQQNLKEDFDNYHQEIKTLIRKCAYIHDDNLYKDNKDLINFIINITRIERLVDRQENILDDFSYINN